ncbi:MAG: hypothetical protein J3K34DRAFT_522900 [Monoraphidium minutum]|nr:MAG: hypothetical protein J3K34DRAFT_522900 [Monoraphidium minutum]
MLGLRRPLLQQLLGITRQCACSTGSQDPWTPTRLLEKRKTYQKRMRHMITTLESEYVSKVNEARQLPDFRSGDILEVQVAVPEADRKVYTYRGVCLARANKGPRSWFKIYNVFPDAGGVVQHFPLFMPDLVSLRVMGRVPRARRAKLYHLTRDESGAHTYQSDVAPPK